MGDEKPCGLCQNWHVTDLEYWDLRWGVCCLEERGGPNNPKATSEEDECGWFVPQGGGG